VELTLRHMTMLCAIEESGSITRAASRLGMSQPALTAQLRRIEAELGGQVFTRSNSGVCVTRSGRRVLTHARTAQTAMSRLRESSGALPAGPQSLRIGGGGPILIALIDHLAETDPSTTVMARAERSSRLIQAELEQGKLDYAVLREYPGHELPRPEHIAEWELVAAEPLFVGLSRNHPLARQSVIDLAQLRDEAWAVDPDDDSGETELLREACVAAQFEPRLGLISSDNGMIRSYIGSGRALGLFEARASQDHELVVRPLHGNPVRCRIVLRWSVDQGGLAIPSERVSQALATIYEEASNNHPVYRDWRAAQELVKSPAC
jgi:DNA-binding transcriptional LysR family regulator